MRLVRLIESYRGEDKIYIYIYILNYSLYPPAISIDSIIFRKTNRWKYTPFSIVILESITPGKRERDEKEIPFIAELFLFFSSRDYYNFKTGHNNLPFAQRSRLYPAATFFLVALVYFPLLRRSKDTFLV